MAETTLYDLIREERQRHNWSQVELADQMNKLSSRSGNGYDFTSQQVARLESRRFAFRPKTDPSEPLWWALRVLGIDEQRAKGMLGL